MHWRLCPARPTSCSRAATAASFLPRMRLQQPKRRLRPTWVNMDTGLNTIEFYAGDISGNFATAAAPHAVGGAQDNGPSSVNVPGHTDRTCSMADGSRRRRVLRSDRPDGNRNKPSHLGRAITAAALADVSVNCTNSGAGWTSSRGSWTGDQQSFVLPINLFHGGIPGGDDCGPAGRDNRLRPSDRGHDQGLGDDQRYKCERADIGLVQHQRHVMHRWHESLPDKGNAWQPLLSSTRSNTRPSIRASPLSAPMTVMCRSDLTSAPAWRIRETGSMSQAATPCCQIVLYLGVSLDPSVAAANLPVGYAARRRL